MKGKPVYRIAIGFAVAAVAAPWTGQVDAQTDPRMYPYESISTSDWGRLPPERPWGAPSGVEIDPDGTSLWVIERCGDFSGPGCAESNVAPVLEFDASGKLVRSFGAGMFVFPHGLAEIGRAHV